MDVLGVFTLAVAVLALVVAGFSWSASYRQADAAQQAADEAERATEVAAEALTVAKQAHDLETTRLIAEFTPRLRLDPANKAASFVQQFHLTNEGPVRYQQLVIGLRPTSLVLGFEVGAEGDADIVAELRSGPIEVGEHVLINLRKDDPEHAGTVLLTVAASREDGSWDLVLPVTLHRPPPRPAFGRIR